MSKKTDKKHRKYLSHYRKCEELRGYKIPNFGYQRINELCYSDRFDLYPELIEKYCSEYRKSSTYNVQQSTGTITIHRVKIFNNTQYVTWLENSGDIIGLLYGTCTQLMNISKRVMQIEYFVLEKYRGYGWGNQLMAFHLDLLYKLSNHYIEEYGEENGFTDSHAIVYDGNVKSINLLKKFGYICNDDLRYYKDGVYQNDYFLSINDIPDILKKFGYIL